MAACLLLLAARTAAAYRDNWLNLYCRPNLPDRFTADPRWSAYPDEGVSTLIMGAEFGGNERISDPTIVLEKPVRYYERVGGEYVLAREYQAGTRVYFGFDFMMDNRLATFPTCDAGWRRMTRMPILPEELAADRFPDREAFLAALYTEVVAQNPMEDFYVPLSDVQSLVDTVFARDPEYWRETFVSLGKAFPGHVPGGASDGQIRRGVLLAKDMLLYHLGWFDSPDLHVPYFDGWSAALLAAAVLCAALYAVLRAFAR